MVRDKRMEVCRVQAQRARRLAGAQAGHGGAAEQERQFAEMIAGDVAADYLLGATQILHHIERPGEQAEERRGLALLDQPFAGLQLHICGARRDGLPRRRRERGKQ